MHALGFGSRCRQPFMVIGHVQMETMRQRARLCLGTLVGAGALICAMSWNATEANILEGTEGEPQTREEASRAGTQQLIQSVSARPRQAVRNVLQRAFFDLGALDGENPIAIRQAEAGVAGTDADGDAWDRFARNSGIWANFTVQDSEDKVTDFQAQSLTRTVLVGYDRFVRDDLLVGVALGYTVTKTDSLSFGAVATQTNDLRQETASISPYMAYILDDNYYFDWVVGATTELSNSRTVGGGFVNISSTEGKTYFTALGANAVAALSDRWTVNANLSLMRSITTFDGTADLTFQTPIPSQKVGTTVVSGSMQFGYVMDRVIPYITVGFDHHLTDRKVGLEEGVVGASGVNQQENEPFNGVIALGIDMYATDHFTVSAEISKSDFFRFGNRTIGGFFNLRYDF